MKTKGFASVIIVSLFECDRAHGFKHAASTHESLLTVICVIASFFIFMLTFKYIARRLHTSYTRGLARFLSSCLKRSSR